MAVSHQTLAATYRQQKDGFFEFDMPDGWYVWELASSISVSNPQGDESIGILWSRPGVSQPHHGPVIRSFNPEEVTVLQEVDIKVDGRPARRVDYQVPADNKSEKWTSISASDSGYDFQISFAWPEKDESGEKLRRLEQIIGSLKFLHRRGSN